MNVEWKAKWIAALRSGLYSQTTGVLKDENGYCCLGVLCDISGLGQWEPWGSQRSPSATYRADGQIPREGLLPELVRDTTGLLQSAEPTLSGMNDMHGTYGNARRYEFNAIADWIEANL